MYTVTSAARISSGSLLSDASKDAAVPWNAACTLIGMPMSFCAFSMASVAAPSEAFGARLKEIVTTGNCPWWLTASGALVDSKWVNALRAVPRCPYPVPDGAVAAATAPPVSRVIRQPAGAAVSTVAEDEGGP